MKNIIKKLSTIMLNSSASQLFSFSATKAIALVIVISLLLGTIGNNAYAVAQSFNNEQEENTASKFSEGKITSCTDAGSNATVVNIQDLHCHYQTQQNISTILKEIEDNYGIKAICVEGGYGQIDTSWLSNIKDENLKQTLTDKLLEEGELTGAEYYVIKNNKKDILKGLDEEKTHKENIKRLSDIIENENKYAKTVERVKYIINKLNKKYVNRRSRKFTDIVNKYRQEKIDTAKYYGLMLKYIEKINKEPQKYNNIIKISKTDYPNISKYIQLTSNNKKVKTKQVTVELQQLLTELKQKLSYGEYSNMLADTKNLKNTDKLISYIQYYANENKINLEKYTQLNNFVKLNYINNSLNPVEMIKEETALEDQIRKALAYNLTEYEIAYITSFEQYFEKYLNYGLTCIEWKYFETGIEKFRKLYTKYAVVDRIKEIEKDFYEINKYYQTNETRNSIFMDNITKYITDNKKVNIKQKRNAEQILKDSKEIIVVVSGGYHSEELKDMLSDENINDIVITPNVLGDIDISSEKYKQIIKGQGKIQSQALAYTLASCATDEKQKELLIKTAVDIVGFDNVSKLSGILGNQIETEEILFKKAKNEFVIKTSEGNFQIANTIDEEVAKSKIKETINIVIDNNRDLLSKLLFFYGIENIFYPNNEIINKLIIEIGFVLSASGFNFDNNGIIFDIENSDYSGADILGMYPEQYSDMSKNFQEAVVKTQEEIDKNKKYKVVNIELSSDKQNYEIVGFHEETGKGISSRIRKKNENNYSFFIDKNTIKDFYGGKPTSTIQNDNDYIYEQIKNMKDNNLSFVTLGQLSDDHINILGKEQKDVILKNNIVKKNLSHHPDISIEQYGSFLEPLKNPDYILQNQPNRPNYYSFIKEVENNEDNSILSISLRSINNYNNKKSEIDYFVVDGATEQEIIEILNKNEVFTEELFNLSKNFVNQCENFAIVMEMLNDTIVEYKVDSIHILRFLLREENINYINENKDNIEVLDTIIYHIEYLCLFLNSKMSLKTFVKEINGLTLDFSLRHVEYSYINVLNYLKKFNDINEIDELYFEYRKNKFLAPDSHFTLKKVEDYCYPILEILGVENRHIYMNLMINMGVDELKELRMFLKNCTPEEINKIKGLFLSLIKLGDTAIDTDKNCLSLKIFLNNNLTKMFANLDEASQYYKIALSVSHIIPDDIAEEITDEIVNEYLQLYIEPLQNNLSENLF
uniref:hypothetical protein n=1 Tax=Candidatus Ruminimicrobium bovinum TaxID=3242779 RepID=UPI0039B9CA5C